jgi:hypothetical protein
MRSGWLFSIALYVVGCGAESVDQRPAAAPDAQAWINADACPDPVDVAAARRPYLDAIDRALRDDVQGELATMRIQPSFQPPRSLSVRRLADGSHRLRSLELDPDLWARVMAELPPWSEPSRDRDAREQAASAQVIAARTVREREIDGATARLILQLWGEVMARAQVVEEINAGTGKGDGTVHEMRLGDRAARMHEPSPGSVLRELVVSVGHLENYVNYRSPAAPSQLEVARQSMRAALERTQNQEPCLKRYFGSRGPLRVKRAVAGSPSINLERY